jgi:DNA-binding NarL/FixJ family response regulator
MAQITELTAREHDVMARLVRGERNAEIARALVISETTVETHLRNIYGKLGVSSRIRAVLYYLRNEGAQRQARLVQERNQHP